VSTSPSRKRFDWGLYYEALRVHLRYPLVLAGPLAAALVRGLSNHFLAWWFNERFRGGNETPNDLTYSLVQVGASFVTAIVVSFCAAFAFIAADAAWSGEQISLGETRERLELRLPEVTLVAIIVYVVAGALGDISGYIQARAVPLLGGQLGLPMILMSEALLIAVTFFIVYALPAVSIGAVSGFGAATRGIRLAFANAGPTLLLAAVTQLPTMVTFPLSFQIFASVESLANWLEYQGWLGLQHGAEFGIAGVVVSWLHVFIPALFGGYIALVTVRTYEDLAASASAADAAVRDPGAPL
jgi:hypothetical protein